MAKLITLDCPKEAIEILVNCITTYAHAAYPEGASECAQASRAALLDAALQIKRQAENNDFPVQFSRRLGTNIKAALLYCDETYNKPQHELLIKAISGQKVNKREWGLD